MRGRGFSGSRTVLSAARPPAGPLRGGLLRADRGPAAGIVHLPSPASQGQGMGPPTPAAGPQSSWCRFTGRCAESTD